MQSTAQVVRLDPRSTHRREPAHRPGRGQRGLTVGESLTVLLPLVAAATLARQMAVLADSAGGVSGAVAEARGLTVVAAEDRLTGCPSWCRAGHQWWEADGTPHWVPTHRLSAWDLEDDDLGVAFDEVATCGGWPVGVVVEQEPDAEPQMVLEVENADGEQPLIVLLPVAAAAALARQITALAGTASGRPEAGWETAA